MTPVLRRAMPVLMAALAVAHTGCSSKSPERTPTGPQAPVAGEEGRLSAMAVAPPLGAAAPFAVLGASTVTNTGPTVLTGDMGVSPGAACTGFPAPCTGGPGIVTGTIHLANATSLAAQNSIVTAYNALAGQACDINLTGTDLGGLTLTPGAYCFSTSAQLTGTLTLERPGQPGRGLGLPDREHAHDREQRACRLHQRRPAVRHVLAGRQLGDARHHHRLQRKRSRAGEHHPEHRRGQRGRPLCAHRCGDAGHQRRHQCRKLRRRPSALADAVYRARSPRRSRRCPRSQAWLSWWCCSEPERTSSAAANGGAAAGASSGAPPTEASR